VHFTSAVPFFVSAVCGFAASHELTIEIKDYATLPMTGAVDGAGNSAGLLARINFLREEPGGGRKRLFVNDLNGPLYILDRETKKTTTYLDFNGLPGKTGYLPSPRHRPTPGERFISFEFDPDYAHNGKFYTIHLEDPSLPCIQPTGQQELSRLEHVGIRRYARDPHIRTHGTRGAVLVEWTDTNVSNCNVRRHRPVS